MGDFPTWIAELREALDPGLRLGFPVQFEEAIQWAKRRGTELPEEYYGTRLGIARARAFTVSNMAAIEQIGQVQAQMQKALETGGTFKEWKRLMEMRGWPEEALALPAHRQELVFRNYMQSAYGGGRWQQQSTNTRRPFLMYDAIEDSRTRPNHAAMDGTIRRADDPFWITSYPPNGHNAILPGQRVSGAVELALKARYAGPAVEIIGKSGNRLSVTVNHPVLTGRGWVLAKDLREGDDLVSYRGDVDWGAASAHPNKDHSPAKIEQVFEPAWLGAHSVVAMAEIPRAAFNLHGDLQFLHGDVQVVCADRELMEHIKAVSAEIIAEVLFHRPGASLGSAFTSGNLLEVSRGQRRAVAGFKRPLTDSLSAKLLVSGGLAVHVDPLTSQVACNVFPAFAVAGGNVFEGHPAGIEGNDIARHWLSESGARNPSRRRPSKPRTFRLGAKLNPALTDVFVGGFGVNANALGALRDAHPGRIELDEVVDLRWFDYCGHVYDLQTVSGHILAFGGVGVNHYVLSNCRCSVVGLTEAEARARPGWEKAVEADAIPDPGWDYNPGLAWDDKLDDLLGDAIENLPPEGKAPFQPWADLLQPELDKRLAYWAERHGMQVEELARRIDLAVKEQVASADVWVAMPREMISGNLLGTYKIRPGSTANTNENLAELMAMVQGDFERKVLGIKSAEKAARPVYGYLSQHPFGRLGTSESQRGLDDVAIKLKRSTRPRTRIGNSSPYDTLFRAHKEIIPEGIDAATYRSAGLVKQNDPLRPGWVNIDGGASSWSAYIEGDINLTDIEKLVFRDPPSKALAKRMDRLGVKWETLPDDFTPPDFDDADSLGFSAGPG